MEHSSDRPFLPRAFALAASPRRWSSVNRVRLPPSCSRYTWFSVLRYSMTSCWLRFTRPARKARTNCRCRVVDQTCRARGACEPALKLRRGREGPTRNRGQGRQPDSRNSTVRDENGGLRKRDHGSRTEACDESHGIATGPYRARAGDLSKSGQKNALALPFGFLSRSQEKRAY